MSAVASAFLLAASTVSCGADSAVGTAEDRQALVDYLIAKTLERESFSPFKHARLGLDVETAMRVYEDAIVGADTAQELFYALVKLSNARRDRHLEVWEIEGGLAAPRYYPSSDEEPPTAPIRVEFDYSRPDDVVVFVTDVSTDPALNSGIERGDKILTINGVGVADRFQNARPYLRYSTELGYRKKFAHGFATRTGLLPPEFYAEKLNLTVERSPGETMQAALPYMPAGDIEWQSSSETKYAGFELVADRDTFDLYSNTDGRSTLLIDWHGFYEHLVEDMDWLMQYASDKGLLNHDIVWDGTNSGGGSRGAYAIRRLSPKPFKTTFGNLRMSDIIPEFIARKVREFEEQQIADDGVPETMDDGSWLIDWLADDVQKGYQAGQEYSNVVPFKLAHAPKYSDGILQPAQISFRGKMVCFFGPNGGSHLDQFAAIVSDNELCRAIGMPTGGYSNTWEWEEDVVFPTNGRPVIGFMWSIGHTITPAGKIVEGNPAEIDEYVPLTRDNFNDYYSILLSRAFNHLSE